MSIPIPSVDRRTSHKPCLEKLANTNISKHLFVASFVISRTTGFGPERQ